MISKLEEEQARQAAKEHASAVVQEGRNAFVSHQRGYTEAILDGGSGFAEGARIDVALMAIKEERYRQNAKWGVQNHLSPVWLAILAEEVGEAAQEVLTEAFGTGDGGGHGNLREELVHVAAVATAWIEAIDRKEGR